MLIFCIRHIVLRRDAIIAGLLGGPIAMFPAMLFFITMIGQYELLITEGTNGRLPVTLLLNALNGADIFIILFPIVLFGTFIETGAALIHGFNERINHVYIERKQEMPRYLRPIIASAILLIAIVLADSIGLTSLVAKGYGYITYGFLLVFVIPVLSWGIWLIYKAEKEPL